MNHCRLFCNRINGSGSTNIIGIELNGGGIGTHFTADVQMFGQYIHSCLIGIKATNGACNAIGMYGGAIIGNNGPVASSYGFDLDAAETWIVQGVDIENMETAIRQQSLDTPLGSCQFNTRVEGCTNYVITSSSNNTYDGTSTSAIVTDTGSENDYRVLNIGQYNRARFVQNWIAYKTISTPSAAGSTFMKEYSRVVDSNNDGRFTKVKINGAVQEVQIY